MVVPRSVFQRPANGPTRNARILLPGPFLSVSFPPIATLGRHAPIGTLPVTEDSHVSYGAKLPPVYLGRGVCFARASGLRIVGHVRSCLWRTRRKLLAL